MGHSCCSWDLWLISFSEDVYQRDDNVSADPVENLVVGAGEGQEPWASVVKTKRRTGEWNVGVRIFFRTAADLFGDFCPQIGCHRHAMPRVPDRVIHSIHSARVGHGVKAEIQRPTPSVFH